MKSEFIKRQMNMKYAGKTLFDKEYSETFVFDVNSDWYVLYHHPERFEIVD